MSYEIGKLLVWMRKPYLPGNEALLLAYVRFIMDQEIHEELLFARILTKPTLKANQYLMFQLLHGNRGDSAKAIPLSNIIYVASDGALAMVGRYRGFVSLKQNIPGVLAIHYVI
ncbi:hypothetical protein NQ318_007240 [Aromia moschata]|uniref:Uncharacterized protein n=1 Tax=Aromia moschata TaxID=1265417 RepID=A0AAV8X524_9CUCU|nr:hypothetical protein NQ318_007240 [Aromia moschata]